ncbi:unnamed protein product (macronuclear) [Paramecium tetraurelia]|uniref:IBB domain-containing protein n=1 Tax=Paramecium tetraurelia TaxID=5888 RepID=A0EI60_PARTE|nr:uncharacterized protein GSPATT00027329001 [Paramecium tetraurelia]CAK95001.1 unnamed protein product [Paramecium tetraurelia]|eukprot:XP_001462374.1 hypothetical protein (macronuclear) [Paramecium tetraurelia strain d4-2]
MNDIIITRREQFRIEIRKQNLEKQFKLKRAFTIPQNQQSSTQNNSIQFELNFTHQIENQIQQILHNPTNSKIEMLLSLIQELDVQNKITLINKNVYELLKSPNLDLNLTLLVMYNLFSEPIIVNHIFSDQTQTDRLMQFINYLNDKLMDANIIMFWEFLYILSVSQHTPFLCLKQIYVLCCKEVIESRNSTLSQSARIFPQIIQKFPENFQFYWDTINQLDDEGRRPWKCILYFLKQQGVDHISCQYLLLTIYYFIKQISDNQEDYKFYQIVNQELMSILLINMNRHEKTLVVSAQLCISIFERDNTYFSYVVEDLVKLLYNISIEGQIEVLKILDLLLRDESIVRLAIKSQYIIEQLFNLLGSNIQIIINYLALKCISNSIARCSNIQLFSIICNEQYKSTLERYSLDANKQLKEMAQQLLDFYFEY